MVREDSRSSAARAGPAHEEASGGQTADVTTAQLRQAPPGPHVGPGGSSLVAGARYEATHDAMGERLARRWALPKSGRRMSSSTRRKS